MGPNATFANNGAGTSIVAIECEYDAGGLAGNGDPPDDSYCNAQTGPADFPMSTNLDGSFDYSGLNAGDLANVWQLPDANFPHSTITCDATHACTWYVGADYTDFSAAHFFSPPFYVVSSPPAFTSTASDTVIAGNAFTFPVTATGSPAPTISENGKPPLPSGVTLSPTGPGTATLAGTSSLAAGTYDFTLVATSSAAASPATQNFVLTILSQAVQVLSPAAANGDSPTCAPGSLTCGTVTWTAFGIGNKYPVGSPGPYTWHAVVPGTNSYCSSALQGCLAHLPTGMKFKPLNHTTAELIMTPSVHAVAGTYTFSPQAEVTAKINGVATKEFANGPTYTIIVP